MCVCSQHICFVDVALVQIQSTVIFVFAVYTPPRVHICYCFWKCAYCERRSSCFVILNSIDYSIFGGTIHLAAIFEITVVATLFQKYLIPADRDLFSISVFLSLTNTICFFIFCTKLHIACKISANFWRNAISKVFVIVGMKTE